MPPRHASPVARLLDNPVVANGLSLVSWVVVSQVMVLATYGAFASVVRSNKPPVNRATCTCDCFDAAFKNGYGSEGYKSIYFNIDEAMPLLVSWTALFVVLGVIAFRTLLEHLVLGRIRWSFFGLFLGTVYPLFYAYWALWNYYNDRFYPMVPSQLFYCFSEMAMSLVIVTLCNRETPTHPAALWFMVGVSGVHALRNRLDQSNPLFGVLLMGVIDWLILGTALAHIWWSIGATHVSLWDATSKVISTMQAAWSAITSGRVPAPASAADDTPASASTAVAVGGHDGKPAAPLSFATFVYTREAAGRDAVIAIIAITTCLLVLPLTGWF